MSLARHHRPSKPKAPDPDPIDDPAPTELDIDIDAARIFRPAGDEDGAADADADADAAPSLRPRWCRPAREPIVPGGDEPTLAMTTLRDDDGCLSPAPGDTTVVDRSDDGLFQSARRWAARHRRDRSGIAAATKPT